MTNLMSLRKLAYGERKSPPAQDTAEGKESFRKLRAVRGKIKKLVGIEQSVKARAAAKNKPGLEGCRYTDPGSGVRCAAPCTGALCDVHKNAVPAYNGSGSYFYALNPKESNPNRR